MISQEDLIQHINNSDELQDASKHVYINAVKDFFRRHDINSQADVMEYCERRRGMNAAFMAVLRSYANEHIEDVRIEIYRLEQKEETLRFWDSLGKNAYKAT
jgi:hypothetical protein